MIAGWRFLLLRWYRLVNILFTTKDIRLHVILLVRDRLLGFGPAENVRRTATWRGKDARGRERKIWRWEYLVARSTSDLPNGRLIFIQIRHDGWERIGTFRKEIWIGRYGQVTCYPRENLLIKTAINRDIFNLPRSFSRTPQRSWNTAVDRVLFHRDSHRPRLGVMKTGLTSPRRTEYFKAASWTRSNAVWKP